MAVSLRIDGVFSMSSYRGMSGYRICKSNISTVYSYLTPSAGMTPEEVSKALDGMLRATRYHTYFLCNKVI